MTFITPERLPLYQAEIDRLKGQLKMYQSRRDQSLAEGTNQGKKNAKLWEHMIATVEKNIAKYEGWVANSAPSEDDQ